mgnify:CR=1 FL=1
MDNFYNYYNLEDYLKKNLIDPNEAYLRWVKDIINTKVSMFEYRNLPDGLTSEIVENALMFNNFLCFYHSEALGLILCRYRMGSEFNLYWKPTYVQLMTLSGKTIANHVPYEDIIPIRDNRMDIIPFVTLNGYISKIIEQEKTLDVLVRLVRFPTILTGSKEQMQMLKNLLKKNANCDGFTIADKGFKDHIEQFPINLPCKLIEAYELMDKYKEMALGSIGIYSVDEKRERIVTEEVKATNDFVDFIYNGMVQERTNALKAVNERWGYDIVLEESYVENIKDEQELEARGVKLDAKAEASAEPDKKEDIEDVVTNE